MQMRIKAIYKDEVLKPLEKLGLKEGEEVEIEISKSRIDQIVDLLKDIDLSSLELQHEKKEIWVKKSVSY
jgi:predicted DNA-binding antitoxin AbrB/MazE fold protein